MKLKSLKTYEERYRIWRLMVRKYLIKHNKEKSTKTLYFQILMPPIDWPDDMFHLHCDVILISNKTVTELPKNLKSVDGNLIMSHTNITHIPKSLKTVTKTFSLYHTGVSSLPDNLYVGGDLKIGRTNISELPKNLRVCGDLIFPQTTISHLPDDIYVGGDIYCQNTYFSLNKSVDQIKNEYPNIKGRIVK